ncbi:MAG: DUF4215 domain-containing protein [Kiritimatiellales bacterium]|nr:DUF4215 domain-containing protein [Kiritimatiellales bacterium]
MERKSVLSISFTLCALAFSTMNITASLYGNSVIDLSFLTAAINNSAELQVVISRTVPVAGEPIEQGEPTLRYLVTVKNIGNARATNVRTASPIPQSKYLTSRGESGTCSKQGSFMVCGSGLNLEPGQEQSYWYKFGVSADIPCGANMGYNAAATADNVSTVNSDMNQDTIFCEVDKEPVKEGLVTNNSQMATNSSPILQLTLSKVLPDVVEPGTPTLRYLLTIKNVGTTNADNIIAYIPIPQSQYLTLRDKSGACNKQGNNIICSSGLDLSPNQEHSYWYKFGVSEDIPCGATIYSTAVATADNATTGHSNVAYDEINCSSTSTDGFIAHWNFDNDFQDSEGSNNGVARNNTTIVDSVYSDGAAKFENRYDADSASTYVEVTNAEILSFDKELTIATRIKPQDFWERNINGVGNVSWGKQIILGSSDLVDHRFSVSNWEAAHRDYALMMEANNDYHYVTFNLAKCDDFVLTSPAFTAGYSDEMVDLWSADSGHMYGGPVPQDPWMSIAVTVDDQQNAKMYINGEMVASKSFTSDCEPDYDFYEYNTFFTKKGNTFRIGTALEYLENTNSNTSFTNRDYYNSNFSGLVDDVKIWNRALSESEILGMKLFCGNGIKEQNEVCDGSAECSRICTIPVCGDNVKEGEEECDEGIYDGGADARNCTNRCTIPVCGDGIWEETLEGCDDGNLINGDGCSDECKVTTQCTDDVDNDGDLKMDEEDQGCKTPMCGNRLDKGCQENSWNDELDYPVQCGNGIIENGEECDDANNYLGDGCSACKLEESPCGGICSSPDLCYGYTRFGRVGQCGPPGATLPGGGLTPATPTHWGYIEYKPTLYNGCPCAPSCDESEVCFVHASGVSTCAAPDAEVGTRQNWEACEPHEIMNCPCEPVCGDSQSCYINDSNENSTCSASGQNPSGWTECLEFVCGNGIPQEGEECDDGNDYDLDTCSNECKNNVCGDSIVQDGEECDIGLVNCQTNASCSCDCEQIGPPNCGDEIVQENEGEECDLGVDNLISNSGCNPKCQYETCGDGFVKNGYEECDFGEDNGQGKGCDSECNIDEINLCRTCTPFVNDCPSGTTCFVKNDGSFSTACHSPQTADNHLDYTMCQDVPYCGNMVIDTEVGEECDYGTANSDNTICKSDCTINTDIACARCDNKVCAAGHECFVAPDATGQRACKSEGFRSELNWIQCPTTHAVCGNNIKEGSEQCDDGNTTNGDGCDNTCLKENACSGCSITECTDDKICYQRVLDDLVICESPPSILSEFYVECDEGSMPDCGNGTIEGAEECDNGSNNSDTVPNACREDCTDPICGDGITDSANGEDCDDGNTTNGDGCDSECQTEHSAGGDCYACENWNCASNMVCYQNIQYGWATCANSGIQTTDFTECGPTGEDGPECGDGLQEGAEECDNGSNNSDSQPNACRTDCKNPVCGDHVIDTSFGEDCDDGNLINGDGCNAQCYQTYQCNDGVDNDEDGVIDDDDPGCEEEKDNNEGDGTTQCQDGKDNDDDGFVDLVDPGCENKIDNDEFNVIPECSDGKDNDDDGVIDDDDPGCYHNQNLITGVYMPNDPTEEHSPGMGNGLIEGSEECDDGNLVNDDGCDYQGNIEEAVTCDCWPQCGNGKVCFKFNNSTSTVCASPNASVSNARRCTLSIGTCSLCASESCSPNLVCYANRNKEIAQCVTDGLPLPSGWTDCTEYTVYREPYCGDGIPEGDEECDDGDNDNLDICDNQCKVPKCGNGEKEYIEECDDGSDNSNSEDGACREDCKRAHCGDGVTDLSKGEKCDDGNNVNTDYCSNSCKLPICGNNIKEGDEECDDGDGDNADGCSNDCKLPDDGLCSLCDLKTCPPNMNCYQSLTKNEASCSSAQGAVAGYTACGPAGGPTCGDGVKDANEQCDDGNDDTSDLCSNYCHFPFCGNNVIEGWEECDDGNRNNGDACNSTCEQRSDPGDSCAACDIRFCPVGKSCYQTVSKTTTICSNPGIATTAYTECGPTNYDWKICGNGNIESNEACDDGNKLSGDGCSYDACAVETGWSCHSSCSSTAYSSERGIAAFFKNIVASIFSFVTAQSSDNCVSICEPICRDGITRGDEECDDGDNIDDNECSNSCTVNHAAASECGNGITEEGEDCDDGNKSNNDACLNSCDDAACGDGYERAGVEECDDGDQNSDTAPDACRLDCTKSKCGDGVIDSDEQCLLGQDSYCGSGNVCNSNCQCEQGHNADYSCSDTDASAQFPNGNGNIFTKGTMTLVDGTNSIVHEDECYLSKYLKEWSCGSSNKETMNYFFCKNSCQNGACIPDVVVPEEVIPDEEVPDEEYPKCTDTDAHANFPGGYGNIHKMGTVTVIIDDSNSIEYKDECYTSSNLKEWSCKSESVAEFKNYYCPKGCKNGKCKL